MSISVFLTFVCHLYPSDNFYTMLLRFCLLQIITEPDICTRFPSHLRQLNLNPLHSSIPASRSPRKTLEKFVLSPPKYIGPLLFL
jgi:hypothetical protein